VYGIVGRSHHNNTQLTFGETNADNLPAIA
jgi:hypothetical protein